MGENGIRAKKIKLTNLPLEKLRSSDIKYWNKLKTFHKKEETGIAHISFSGIEPYNFVTTTSHKLTIYDNSKTRELEQLNSISDYPEKVYGANFRSDGKLIIVGSEKGLVKAYDLNSKSFIRTFIGHKKAVHTCSFSYGNYEVMSGGDDTTVRLWELSDGRQISRYDGHREYVRTLQQSSDSVNIWASGSYDHVCRIWDTRLKSDSVAELDHGDVVNSIAFLSKESCIVTAGGLCLNIWDIRKGDDEPIRCMRAHRKSIMSISALKLAYYNETRLVSVGLDNYFKIHDMDGNTTHTVSYDNPILSVGVDEEGSTIAIGLANGTLITKRYFLSTKAKKKVNEDKEEGEEETTRNVIKPSHQKIRLTDYEEAFKHFKYKEALDLAVNRNNIKIVISVIDELLNQNAMEIALENRYVADFLPLLTILRCNMDKPEVSTYFTGILMKDEKIKREMIKILDNIKKEWECYSNCIRLGGVLDGIL